MSASEPRRALPRGPHGLSREEVERSQRRRLLQATTDVVSERGYVKTTVAHILEAAGVSRATFYALFADREACFHAAYAANAEMVAEVMEAELRKVRADRDRTPLDRLSRLLYVYLDALRSAPTLARVFLVEVYAGGPAAIEQRRQSLDRFVDLVAETHRGEKGVLGTRADQRFAAQAFVGAVSSLVTNAVGVGETDRLLDLHAPLMKLARQITKS
ncbi:MAG TPA: TetR/AcrR family transcriptional regulator [Acidimicrobiales bacterium]|jgi:AcrR family transcriptional regulator|nr:TetR/AcrR family transcriptional regulator [Acidimicrobiales bacterium]